MYHDAVLGPFFGNVALAAVWCYFIERAPRSFFETMLLRMIVQLWKMGWERGVVHFFKNAVPKIVLDGCIFGALAREWCMF